MPILNDKERESVAIGAAIGAGCRPCTQYHVRAALKAGLREEEVRQAVSEAEVLRIQAATSVADFARGLLGGGEESDATLCYPSEPLQALAQVGAATGGNAGPVLDWLLPQARGLGLTNESLTEAVELAGMVKKMAGEFFRKDAERALQRSPEVQPAAAAGRGSPCVEPVGQAPGSCC
ncbi:MAG TPA: carboxymuconolactone decarboxylase family protein [Dehalococcoidia bacterium]|nr:carboxymuconolactone decarboxylase family protein [Dehalococcoidia bacterium]